MGQRAGQQDAPAKNRKEPWPQPRTIATELPPDSAGEPEKQESGHDECGNLNPAVGPDRVFAYRRTEPIEARAEQVLEREDRDKKYRGGRAGPRCLPRRTGQRAMVTQPSADGFPDDGETSDDIRRCGL